MSKPEFKLPRTLNKQILALATDLNAHSEIMTRRFDRQTKTWRASDEGNEALGWLEDLDEVVEALNDFAEVEET